MTAMMELSPMTELTAGELDAVAGGQAHAIATGLVASVPPLATSLYRRSTITT